MTSHITEDKTIQGHSKYLTYTRFSKDTRAVKSDFGPLRVELWPHMGQIRDFFRSEFSTFWLIDNPGVRSRTKNIIEKIIELNTT